MLLIQPLELVACKIIRVAIIILLMVLTAFYPQPEILILLQVHIAYGKIIPVPTTQELEWMPCIIIPLVIIILILETVPVILPQTLMAVLSLELKFMLGLIYVN